MKPLVDPPEKAGWHWFREYPSWPWRIVFVDEDMLQEGWTVWVWFDQKQRRCQWAGPIPEPESV